MSLLTNAQFANDDLVAYITSNLDSSQAHEVERAAALDQELAARIAIFRFLSGALSGLAPNADSPVPSSIASPVSEQVAEVSSTTGDTVSIEDTGTMGKEINCEQTTNAIPAYVLGTLDNWQSPFVGAHIDNCIQCARLLVIAVQASVNLQPELRAAKLTKPVEVPGTFEARILSILMEEKRRSATAPVSHPTSNKDSDSNPALST